MHVRRGSRQSYQCSAYNSHPVTGRSYMFQYVPAVSALSSTAGAAGGGLMLTLTGRGFVAGATEVRTRRYHQVPHTTYRLSET
jgi:hypothetical protein